MKIKNRVKLSEIKTKFAEQKNKLKMLLEDNRDTN